MVNDFIQSKNILIIFISLVVLGCIKKSSPVSGVQQLLTNKPWYLKYTDSLSIDTNGIAHFYRISATECLHEESRRFISVYTYQQTIYCNQSVPQTLYGEWILDEDSLLSYGLNIDSVLNPATIHEISADTMKLIEFHSYDNTPSHNPIYVTDTYSH